MITAVINGYSTVGTKASFAVVIEDVHGNRHERVIALDTKSSYMAELAAMKYALLATTTKDKIIVKTCLKHLPPIFEKKDDKWKKKQKTNKEIVNSLRELSEEFDSFECVIDDGSDTMALVKELARSL